MTTKKHHYTPRPVPVCEPDDDVRDDVREVVETVTEHHMYELGERDQ